MSQMVGRSSTAWVLGMRGGSGSDDTYARARRQGRRVERRAWAVEAAQEIDEMDVRAEIDHLTDLAIDGHTITEHQWQNTPARREAYRLWESGLL